MTAYTFSQVDVFGSASLLGNPVAVVHDASGLDDEQMAAFARWTNLSETTFLLPPTTEAADYRLRIFTPGLELPFAGHPTLGSAHAWSRAGGRPRTPGRLVQECGLGLVTLRLTPGQDSGQDSGQEAGRDSGEGSFAFAAPDFLRSGAVDEADLDHVVGALGLEPHQLVAAEWIDNGPGWLGLELDSAETVLSLRPDFGRLRIDTGVLGPHAPDEAARLGAAYEVRAFCPGVGVDEDPVTGSLNAGFARWLTRAGRLPREYVARQGTALGRDGRIRVSTDDDGEIWVGGSTRTVVEGTLTLQQG